MPVRMEIAPCIPALRPEIKNLGMQVRTGFGSALAAMLDSGGRFRLRSNRLHRSPHPPPSFSPRLRQFFVSPH